MLGFAYASRPQISSGYWILWIALTLFTWANKPVYGKNADVNVSDLGGDDSVNQAAEEELDLETELSSAERISNNLGGQVAIAFRRGPGVQLGLDLYRDEDNFFVFKLGHFTAEDRDGFTSLQVTDFTAQNAFYLGESLCVGVGASVAHLRAQDKQRDLPSSDGPKSFSFDAQTYQASFSLSAGNQWQIDNWTFGLHWANLYLPFYVAPVQKNSKDSESSAFALREIKRKQDLISSAWQIDYGFSFDLGYHF